MIDLEAFVTGTDADRLRMMQAVSPFALALALAAAHPRMAERALAAAHETIARVADTELRSHSA